MTSTELFSQDSNRDPSTGPCVRTALPEEVFGCSFPKPEAAQRECFPSPATKEAAESGECWVKGIHCERPFICEVIVLGHCKFQANFGGDVC